MDSFSEPYTRQGDDISIDQVRADIRHLEAQLVENGIPLSGRVLHVCHYLPITATLNSHPGVLSPPPTPPVLAADADREADSKSSSAWTINPRYGHAAMISGIRSLGSTHEQLIIGWTGDIISPSPGEYIPPDTISPQVRERLENALKTYQPKESDPDDERQTTYVPVWLDDRVAHGHYDGYCKQSESLPLFSQSKLNDSI
jgi:trehalose 6-phosphate synthase/phosphatase